MAQHTTTRAYAVGYYYGRTGVQDIAEHDQCYLPSDSFKAGIEDGRADFQEIDLPHAALQAIVSAV